MPPRKCAWMLFANPKSYQYANGLTHSHTAMFGFCSAAHCDRSLGESEYDLSMMRPLWLSGKIAQIKASACVPQPHSLLNSFCVWLFSLGWDRIHSSEKSNKIQSLGFNCLVPFFLRLEVCYSWLHARMGRPNIILQVFPCWDGGGLATCMTCNMV